MEGSIQEGMESTGGDEKDSEKEVESMKDKLFSFGNFAGSAHTEAVRVVV